jgi:hypothetical protein
VSLQPPEDVAIQDRAEVERLIAEIPVAHELIDTPMPSALPLAHHL